jgi:hypothetical protein
MKRKKVLVKSELSDLVYSDDKIKISKDGSNWFFEIGKEVTSDLAEGVSMLLRKIEYNHPIWNIEIGSVNSQEIVPERSLFWLTGGSAEWHSLEHYIKPWSECYLEFQEEFGFLVISCLKKSKNFGELRENFIKYLNLPILYDFAISKNLIR